MTKPTLRVRKYWLEHFFEVMDNENKKQFEDDFSRLDPELQNKLSNLFLDMLGYAGN